MSEKDRDRYDWSEETSLHDLCVKQAKILTGVANALRGDPPDLHHWSHHDLAQRVGDVIAENKRLLEAAEPLCAFHESEIEDGPNCDCEGEGHHCGWPGYVRMARKLRAALRGEEAR